MSATGAAIAPLVIFKGKSVQKQWFPSDMGLYQGWHFTATPNGWTSDDTALEWLQKVFIPNTQPSDLSEARLLIIDGHGIHTTTDFMYSCFQNNIYLLFLPAHTSHILQPLDLAVFSVLKRAYRKQLGYIQYLNDSIIIGKRNFLKFYQRARLKDLSGQNIRAGWKTAGLRPVSMVKPLMSPLLLENHNAGLDQAKKALVTPVRADSTSK